MKSRLKLGLSENVQSVLNDEINRQLAEKSESWHADIDAVILWTLHDEFGFGEKRLKQFYNSLLNNNKELIKHYHLNDTNFVCKYKLKNEVGIDVDEWNKLTKIGEIV